LELMSGIRERRFWHPGTLPSEISVTSARRAIEAADIDPGQIGALIHGSVCRDYLEPATACGVHRQLGLPRRCMIYDVSNACLGIVNGMLQVANMIELGQIRAGLVVGTEGSRQLVETTITQLNRDTSLTRNDVKLALASLTIGSASVAVVLVDKELSRTGNRLLGGVTWADTEHCELCRSGQDEAAADGMRPLMNTDSEALLTQGVAAAKNCFGEYLAELSWGAPDISKTICHQVGRAHRKALFTALGLDVDRDFSTVEHLGNTGSAALPVTAAIAAERGHLGRGDQVAFLGIGSGINVVMLGLDWQECRVLSGGFARSSVEAAALT
jgi:3-oxoacyl-[acyl-carrier-protein] synthase-3